MNVLVLSDIHGNWPALQAIEDHVNWSEIDQVICLGDIVGYGPFPRECVEWVQDNADLVLQGNHDRDFRKDDLIFSRQDIYQSRQLADEQLTTEQKDWLLNLQQKKEVTEDILAVHSHPHKRFVDKHVTPEEYPNLIRYMENYSVLLIGHTHIQSTAEISGKRILNPGSVGQPRDSDKKSAYAIVNTETMNYQFHRVEYDIYEVEKQCKRLDQPEKNWKRLY